MKKSEQPSCVLICGNTKLMDFDTLKLISQYYNVILSGENDLSEGRQRRFSKKLHTYKHDIMSEEFAKLAYAYSPDVIWYISGYTDGGEGLDNEQKKIDRIVNICVVNEVSKLIYISSVNSLNYSVSEITKEKKYKTSKAFKAAQSEEYVKYICKENLIKEITLRTPYIYRKNNNVNYLGELFEKLSLNKNIKFNYRDDQYIDFISLTNLAELMIAVTEEILDEAGEYTVTSGYDNTYARLVEKLSFCNREIEISLGEDYYDLVLNAQNEEQRLRRNYGFVVNEDVLDKMEKAYDYYNKNNYKKQGFREKLGKITSKLSKNVYKVLELVLLFAIVQLLLKFTSDSIYFKYVDLRLFYIIILGITHGMLFGTLAGVFACISLAFSFFDTGVTGTMLFYNTDYWLPFAIYLMTGAIVGYITSAKNKKLEFEEEEVSALQEKYLFLNNVYMSVIDNKEEYKRQILGYQDSFGKIFEAVEKLNSSLPADIFMNGVNTLENILDNHSIAIYTMDDYQKYARLVACSREMGQSLRKSLNMEEFSEVYDTILNMDTWKNAEFKEGLPAYSYAIVENEKVRLMICIYEASSEQYSLYYMNLFTIMCHLIRVAFRRALEYQVAIEDEKYYPDTSILKPEFFEAELESQRKMSEAGVASFILLKLRTNEILDVSHRLQGLIRHSDLVGEDNDGLHYLLLTQINKDIFKNIGERLESNGIEYEILEGI